MKTRPSRFGICVFLLFVSVALACARPSGPGRAEPSTSPVMLIVMGGLRVDYVTPELMPHLTELGAQGAVFGHHQAAFPTLTPVNAASIMTGAWPSTHGILGEALYDPRYSPEPLPIEWAGVLENFDRASGGRALTALTLGELLEGEARDLLAVTSGSSGLAWILGYGAEPRPGRSRMIAPDLFLPSELQSEVTDALGGAPTPKSPPDEKDAWAASVFTRMAMAKKRPDVSILWLAGLEEVQETSGVGSPRVLDAVRRLDDELGAIVDRLRDLGLHKKTNLLVTSDHGFVQHTGNGGLPQLLAEMGFEESLARGDLVAVGNEVYWEGEKEERLEPLVRSLGLQASVGALFTPSASSGRPSGRVEGTLSYETLHLDHERAGNLRVVPNWSDQDAESGFPGRASGPGAAGSGGASPYELQVPFVASGPAFRPGIRTELPSAHIDIAPTVLHLLGIEVPDSMEGRILEESLKGGEGSNGEEPMLRTYRARMPFEGGAERISEVGQQGVGEVSYLRWIRALYRLSAGAAAARAEPAPDSSAGK